MPRVRIVLEDDNKADVLNARLTQEAASCRERPFPVLSALGGSVRLLREGHSGLVSPRQARLRASLDGRACAYPTRKPAAAGIGLSLARLCAGSVILSVYGLGA